MTLLPRSKEYKKQTAIIYYLYTIYMYNDHNIIIFPRSEI